MDQNGPGPSKILKSGTGSDQDQQNFETSDRLGLVGPRILRSVDPAYDLSLIRCEPSNFHQNENISCQESRVFGYVNSIVSSKCLQLTDNICKAVVDETTSLENKNYRGFISFLIQLC